LGARASPYQAIFIAEQSDVACPEIAVCGSVAVVAIAGDVAPTLDELREFVEGRLARYKRPRQLEIVDSLPRNAAGKVLKTELRARFDQPPERS
jgi:acyl-CoA synthetase (AMP-forming)/AMP-acid ligase II